MCQRDRKIPDGEIPGRYVDRDRHRSRNARRRASALPAAGFAQHPASDRNDQAAFLGNRNETLRQHQAPFRMLPAQQRFDAGDALAFKVDLGLVMQRELAAFERPPQITFDQLPLHGALVFMSWRKNW
jgi:hypothetical protein